MNSLDLFDNEDYFFSLVGITKAQFFSLERVMVRIRCYSLDNELITEPGRSRLWGPEDILLLTLLHLRQYPPVELWAWVFGISRSSADRYIRHGITCLFECLKGSIVFPTLEKRLSQMVNVVDHWVSLVIDCSEQAVYSSKIKEFHEATFSGKKWTNTVMYLVACSPQGKIQYVSPSSIGSMNDTMVLSLPENNFTSSMVPGEFILADNGFKGFNNVLMPHPRSQLNPEKERENREISSVRSVVENVFCSLKKWKICESRFRFNHTENLKELCIWHNKVVYICCCFHNMFVRLRV